MSFLKKQFSTTMALLFISLALASCGSHKVQKVSQKLTKEQLVAKKLSNRQRIIDIMLR